jgi:hypothetical protein
MENINRRLEAGESKRPISEYLKVPESTLKKRLRMGTVPTSLGRFKATFLDEEEKELTEYCRDLDAKFHGLTIGMLKELAFEYAERNEIAHTFNRVKKTAGNDWLISFCKRQNFSVRLSEKCSLRRTTSFNEVQVKRFFDNLHAVFEKHNFRPKRIFNMDGGGISTVLNKLPKVIAEEGRLMGKIVSADRGQLLTVVCCFSASGIYFPPAVIFPCKRMCNELFSEVPIGTLPLI